MLERCTQVILTLCLRRNSASFVTLLPGSHCPYVAYKRQSATTSQRYIRASNSARARTHCHACIRRSKRSRSDSLSDLYADCRFCTTYTSSVTRRLYAVLSILCYEDGDIANSVLNARRRKNGEVREVVSGVCIEPCIPDGNYQEVTDRVLGWRQRSVGRVDIRPRKLRDRHREIRMFPRRARVLGSDSNYISIFLFLFCFSTLYSIYI